MSKRRIFVSATIVLFFVFTRDLGASPKPEVPDTPAEAESLPERPLDEGMVISPAPVLHKPPKAVDPEYYPFQQQLTLRTGRTLDFPGLTPRDLVLGFQYLFPKFLSPRLEVGADLREQGRGHLHVGLRKTYHERSYFRPSLKLALDHRIRSIDGLGTFTRHENYFVRFSGTLEYVFSNPYSLRAEAELLSGVEKTFAMFTLGISRGW